jgi:hypothetical protein
MNIRGSHLKKIAVKLGYERREGQKHIVVIGQSGLLTTIPRGRIKAGTLKGILKTFGISDEDLAGCCNSRANDRFGSNGSPRARILEIVSLPD